MSEKKSSMPELERAMDMLLELNKKSKSASVSAKSKYSGTVNKHISSVEELEYYQGLKLEEKKVTRASLTQRKLEMSYLDSKGNSNYARIQAGHSPVMGPKADDAMDLHHLKQGFKAPFAELTRAQHLRPPKGVVIHPKPYGEESWRKDKEKNAAFNAERTEYWRKRAKQIAGK